MAAVRRVITGHTDDGKAIITSDHLLTPHDPTAEDMTPPSGSRVGYVTLFRTEGEGNGFPVKVQGSPTELHGKMIPLVTPNAVTCRIVDFPPKSGNDADKVSFMHRTQSLDYGIVLKGTIELVLDDGVYTAMTEGDVVVQRATIHAWRNTSSQNCRMLFVLVPSEPVKVQQTGETLELTDISHLLPPKSQPTE